jgi:methylmalonyl-CoA/ethylmalonyl-CoA epimerase
MDGESSRDDGHGSRGDREDGRAFAGVDHVGILVHDIAAALPFYLERLGARVIEEQTLDEVGVRVAYVDAGSALIQLVQPTRPGPLTDELAARGEGIHHLCLTVEDIPTMLARLAPEAAADVPVVLGGRGRRACFLPERPHGLRLELTEREPWTERRARAAGGEGAAGESGG